MVYDDALYKSTFTLREIYISWQFYTFTTLSVIVNCVITHRLARSSLLSMPSCPEPDYSYRHRRQMSSAYDVEGAYDIWLQNILNVL